MADEEHPSNDESSEPFKLRHGEETLIGGNRPVRFRIEFQGGTYIEGIVTANNPLTICDRGDIKRFDIVIDDELLGGISEVPE